MANRNSLAQKFQNTINKCDICYCEYNRHEKQPVIICTMHHTICRQCMKDLQSSRKCPYCRETINFSKIVVNNYIFELLPSDPPQANARVQISRPVQPVAAPYAPVQNTAYIGAQYQQQVAPAPNINYQQQQQVALPPSINYQPQQQIYPPNYYPQHQPERPEEYHDFQDDFNFEQRPFDLSDCTSSIANRLRINGSSQRKGIYIVIFLLQLPFLLLDFYFALNGTDKQCYDTPYVTKAYVLRPWLLGMGITEASIMGILFLGALMKVCDCISFSCLKCFEFVVIGMLIVKILLWMYMEIALFTSVIAQHCGGGVYAYGVVQTIIHGILLLIIGCFSICK